MKLPTQPQLSSLLDHYQAGRYSDAETIAISLTEQFPDHPFSWKVLGAILMRTCRMPAALVANHKTVELSPQDFEAHYDLGVTLQELGRFAEAEGSFRQAIELNPDFVEGHYYLGIVLRGLDRLDESEASYRKALSVKPDLAEAILNIGQLFVDRGDYESAIEQFDLCNAIRLTPALRWIQERVLWKLYMH